MLLAREKALGRYFAGIISQNLLDSKSDLEVEDAEKYAACLLYSHGSSTRMSKVEQTMWDAPCGLRRHQKFSNGDISDACISNGKTSKL